jgi:enoyl-CoA hydratase/carnithine racemase
VLTVEPHYDLPGEISVRADGAVRIVTLERADQLNAANDPMSEGLTRVWDQLAADPDASAVVLTGAGKAFSAGGDFERMQRIQADAAFRERAIDEARAMLVAMLRFPLPLIAAVNGPAVGLGCSLALSCDLVLIADDAYLADPHVAVGLVAGDGGAALMPMFTSLLRAKEFLFTGDRISAPLAVELGLANRVVPAAQLQHEALALAQKLAKLPQRALRDTKRVLQLHLEQSVRAPMELGLEAEQRSMASQEHRDRVREIQARAKR